MQNNLKITNSISPTFTLQMTIKMYYEITGDLSPIIKYLWRIHTVPFCTFQVFNNKHICFFHVYKSFRSPYQSYNLHMHNKKTTFNRIYQKP